MVNELRAKYKLKLLLELAGLSRSTFYYLLNKTDIDEKNSDLIEEIKSINIEHKERYGYRRIMLELRNRGIIVNHKKVLRITKKFGLQSKQRKKRKYSSYKGEVGKIAENIIARDFKTEKPNKKWFTDVSEFAHKDGKLYLSPIIDAHGGYIVSYNVSTSPNLEQINDMLDKAFSNNIDFDNLIMHSDQGWQYQHRYFQQTLKNHNVIQSMSRKGNSPDNGLMESFFGTIKSEMFYGYEKTFKSLNDLKLAIEEYIEYYNNKRIKFNLKGLTPALYRNQSLSS